MSLRHNPAAYAAEVAVGTLRADNASLRGDVQSAIRNLALSAKYGDELKAELADANALLLELAGQLWDSENARDAGFAVRARLDGWLTAAQRVLNDTRPYQGQILSRVRIDKVAEGITDRIEHYERKVATVKADRDATLAELERSLAGADADRVRLAADRNKWMRIAAELAADHLGDNA